MSSDTWPALKKGSVLPDPTRRVKHPCCAVCTAGILAFPLSALARMWHEMIAAFTMTQANYKIAVFAGEEHHTLWDLARDQFGSQTPMTAMETRREVLQHVLSGDADVGVLPPPEESEEKALVDAIGRGGAPVIVQRLPFAGVGNVRGVP